MPPAAVIAVEAAAVVRKRRRDSGRMRTGMGASGFREEDECPQNMSARATSS